MLLKKDIGENGNIIFESYYTNNGLYGPGKSWKNGKLSSFRYLRKNTVRGRMLVFYINEFVDEYANNGYLKRVIYGKIHKISYKLNGKII